MEGLPPAPISNTPQGPRDEAGVAHRMGGEHDARGEHALALVCYDRAVDITAAALGEGEGSAGPTGMDGLVGSPCLLNSKHSAVRQICSRSFFEKQFLYFFPH